MSARHLFLPVLALGALLLTACASGPGSAAPAERDLEGTWVPTTSYSTSPFLTLDKDGTWTGSDGCNGGSGTWKLAPSGTLTVTSGPSTLIACEGEALPTVFSQSERVSIEGKDLILQDKKGTTLTTLVQGKAPSTPTPSGDAGSSAVVGTWAAAEPGVGQTPTLILNPDGTLNGNDGCNTLIGSWAQSGDTVTLDALGSTRMACENVDAWLSAGKTARITDAELVVQSAEGKILGRLARG